MSDWLMAYPWGLIGAVVLAVVQGQLNRRRVRWLEARHDALRSEAVRMLGIHQNIISDHASRLRGLGSPAQMIPTMDQITEAAREASSNG